MKKLGVLVGLIACGLMAWSVMAAEPGRLMKGRYVTGEVELSLLAFQVGSMTLAEATSSTGGPVTTSTKPGLEQDDLAPAVVWADGETTKIQQTFRVPSDYLGDGRFIVLATNSNVTTPNKIDFDVVVIADGAGVGSTTNQTTVAFDDATAGYLDEVTLNPVTSFDSLTGGDLVTLRLWRDDAGSAVPSADLELKGVKFIYTQIGD